jgi:hypothetical protein
MFLGLSEEKMERGIESGPKGADSVFENMIERATIKILGKHEKGFDMNVIFYSSTSDERTTEICRGIESSCRNFGLELHHSISSLESRLRQPLHGVALLLLYLSEKSDLSDMMALQEFIIGLPVILIMIDMGGKAIAKARILRPRFLFEADDSFADMGLVIEKILARQSSYGQQQCNARAL